MKLYTIDCAYGSGRYEHCEIIRFNEKDELFEQRINLIKFRTSDKEIRIVPYDVLSEIYEEHAGQG